MPQLYCQLASRPDPWLLGRTSAGLCTLQTACLLTVTYSGGAPAADTIAAGSAATVYGGGAATFDASADVWVVFTVPASGALQVVKESLLATVTGDWAGLARLAQHTAEPYQPQAYLASGGLGPGGSPTTTTVASVTTEDRVLSLWTGSSNSAPPADWQAPSYDDSAWATPVQEASALGAGATPPAPAQIIWSADPAASATERCLFRRAFDLPAGLPASATLRLYIDDQLTGVWLNGTLLPGTTSSSSVDTTISVDPALLVAAGRNVLAIDHHNVVPPDAFVAYILTVNGVGPGGIPAPAGSPVAGDILYYHSGAWVDLPIGTTGQELTVVAGQPAWTDQPADTDTSGTVTSVAFSGPTGTTTGGSPITTSGTITLAWASQSASTFLGAPSGSSGAPTFRALVGADIPVDASTIVSSAGTIKGNYQAGSGVSISGNTISATGSGGSVTSVALSLPGIFSLAGSPITTSGTLAVTLANENVATVFAGPVSGSAAAPTFRTLQGSDLPAAAASGGHIHAWGHFH